MSAITGIFIRDGQKIEPSQIRKMNDVLDYRGPDGSAIWNDGSVGLGHQMLFNTPESLNEKLPFHDENLDLVITAHARIDNRLELFELLEIENSDITDSELILKSFNKWGTECPKKLLGDFTFAIWDINRETLFCARDHMGVKPFYYFLSDEIFLFASEIKAILSVLNLKPELNKMAVYYHLSLFEDDVKSTFFKNIYRLPAATQISLSYDKCNFKEYWVLDPSFEIEMDSDKEYIKKFKDIFTESVNCRLRSAFNIGATLSGGLDSSSVVCTARNILKENKSRNLKTYSAVFDEVKESDEWEYIKEVIDGGSLDPLCLNFDKTHPLRELIKYFNNPQEPHYYPNNYIDMNICRKAQKHGVRVILTGSDGDTTLSHGEGMLREYTYNLRWKELIKELRGRIKNSDFNITFWVYMAEIMPQKLKTLYWILNGYRQNPWSHNKTIKKEFAELSQSKLPENSLDTTKKKVSYSRKSHYEGLVWGANQHVFEVEDLLAARFHVEYRHPFYDRRLIEFCLAIPIELKRRKGWDRYIMRKAMENILPPKIQWRYHKTNLGLNFNRNFILYDKDLIENVIYDEHDYIDEYVNMDEISRIYQECKQNQEILQFNQNLHRSYQKNCESQKIYMAITLAYWLKKYFS